MSGRMNREGKLFISISKYVCQVQFRDWLKIRKFVGQLSECYEANHLYHPGRCGHNGR